MIVNAMIVVEMIGRHPPPPRHPPTHPPHPHTQSVRGEAQLPKYPSLPLCDNPKLSWVAAAMARELVVDLRQTPQVWEPLSSQAVPYKSRKGCACSFMAQGAGGQQAPAVLVCYGRLHAPCVWATDDHARVLKRCFYLHDCLALIRRLWGEY